ncbi:MAG: hypothetical protein R6U27_13400 [Desulfobacterales bacterium]
MRILDIIESVLFKSKTVSKEVRIDLKEILCKPRKKDFIEKFRTTAVGTEYGNPDGSRRQDALKKVKEGNKVRLVWSKGESGSRDIVYLVKGGIGRELDMSNCFGRLDDKTAADVIHRLTKENIVTAARVIKITGGTQKHSKLGCVLELATYHGPVEKR